MKKWTPYLDMVLDLGFMGFRTVLMRYDMQSLTKEYIALHWYFFKFNGRFKLYEKQVEQS